MKTKQNFLVSMCYKIQNILSRFTWIFPSILSVVLFVLAIWGMGDYNQLLLYDDEFGYWAASAYLTGTDWTSVTSRIPYYSYGYGFLILTPIRLIFSNTEYMYKAAIVMNALFLVGSYWIARNVIKTLYNEINPYLKNIICFVVMVYPSNVIFAHIAWAECLLVLVFWIFVWLSIRVVQKPTWINHIMLAVTIMYLYVVHQRTLAVIIATFMIMVYYFVVEKSRRKYIFAFITAFALLFVAHHFIKTDIVNTFYNNNANVAVNNIQGQTQKIQGIFSWDGLLDFAYSILGKWFYLVVASGLMMFWGLGELLVKTIKYLGTFIPQKGKNGQKVHLCKERDTFDVWDVWFLLAFLGNFMICAIYMIGISRNDILTYGRYNEYMIGIYCLIGFVTFLKDANWFPKTLIFMAFSFVAGWICQSVLNDLGLTSYQPYHSVCTLLYLKKGNLPRGGLVAFAVGGIAFATLFIAMIKTLHWKKFDWIRIGIIIFIPVYVYSSISYSVIFGQMQEKQILRVTNIRTIVGWIDRLDPYADVYYFRDTESRYWSESFQFLLKEVPLQVTNSDEVIVEEGAFYIAGDDFLSSDDCIRNYYCVKQTNQFVLLVKKDGALAEKTEELRNN